MTSHALGDYRSRRTLLQQRAAGGCHDRRPESMTSICVYLKNNPAKFHSDLFWNDRALGFLKSVMQWEEQEQQQAIYDQFLIQKIVYLE